MALTLLQAEPAPVSRPAKLAPGELLWAALPLIGILLAGALVLYVVDRWRKRNRAARENASAPSDQLSHFRSLYEQGEMSREEFESIRTLLTGRLRQELNVPAAPAVSPPAAEPPPTETNITAVSPGPQSPPPPEAPPP
jgi:hypothetical protein